MRTHTHTLRLRPWVCVNLCFFFCFGFFTRTLITLRSVWPLEADLQKSNQYVNSVISVRTVPKPFTQKSEPGAFQQSSPYLWYETQILYREGRKAAGYRAATFFPRRFREHVTSLSLTISYENISPTSNVQTRLRLCKSSLGGWDQSRGLHSTCPTPTDLPESGWLPFSCSRTTEPLPRRRF